MSKDDVAIQPIENVLVFRQPEVRKVFQLMWTSKLLLTALVLLTLFAGAAEIAGIGLLTPLLVQATNGSSSLGVPMLEAFLDFFDRWNGADRIIAVAIGLGFVAIIRGILMYMSAYLAQSFRLRIEQQLKQKVLELSFVQDYLEAEKTGFSKIFTYVMSLTSNAAQMASSLATAIGASLMLLFYVAMCLHIAPNLTIFAVVLIALAAGTIRIVLVPKIRVIGVRATAAAIALHRTTWGCVMGNKVVRLFASEQYQRNKFAKVLQEKIAVDRQSAKLQESVSPLFNTELMLIIAALLIVGATIDGEEFVARIPVVILFLFVLSRIGGPVGTLNSVRVSIAGLTHGVRTLFQYIEGSRLVEDSGAGYSLDGIQRGISVENVSFSYASGERDILRGMSLEIEAGKLTALVGPSGGGKSTLVGLLAKLFVAREGRLLVDGEDLGRIGVQEWRRHIAVVSQDTFLFEDSIEENIRVGKPEATFEEIERAAQVAQADVFIENLPDGYKTRLGVRGEGLSGGQQQRIGIARALLRRPEVLILDEATSQLDAETEFAFQNMLDTLRGKVTLLVIAHRLSTVTRADRIYVISEGQVLEEGTHSELMITSGLYRQMVERQMIGSGSNDANELNAT